MKQKAHARIEFVRCASTTATATRGSSSSLFSPCASGSAPRPATTLCLNPS